MKHAKALVPLAILLGAAGFAAWWYLLRDAWQPPQIVQIASEHELAPLFPSYPNWFSDSEEGVPQALLLDDGDYVIGETIYRYSAKDGIDVTLTQADGMTRIGEETIALSLADEDARQWLAGASDAELAGLRTLSVEEEIDPEIRPALERLAALNPNLDLVVDSPDDASYLLSIFRPKFLFAATGMQLPAALAGQSGLEQLFVDASDPGRLDALPELPRLRRLYLSEWNSAANGPLPQGLGALRSLAIQSDDPDDPLDLDTLPAGLAELSLMGVRLAEHGALTRFGRLHTLILWTAIEDDPGAVRPDLSFLADMKRLRRVGLPMWTSQDELADFVRACPGVRILELPGTEHQLDLAPLRELRNLEAVFIGAGYVNLEALRELKSLRYLGISANDWDGSPELIAALRESLPDAVIVRLGSLCLGSGWILLLVPALALAWARGRPRRPAAA